MNDASQAGARTSVNGANQARCAEYPGHDLDAMSAADRYSREIVRGFAPYLGSHAVEVGAGIGNISVLLLQQRLERLDVIEPDARLYAKLSERLGRRSDVVTHRGFLGGVASRIRGGAVDSVVSVNVLEHVEDDVGELALMHSILRPGGHLCLWVPAVPALYIRLDRTLGHYRRYRRSELGEKLARAGFETVFLHYRDLVGMFAWFLVCRVLGQELTKGKVGAYDRFVVPITTFAGRWTRPPIGKNLLALARKP